MDHARLRKKRTGSASKKSHEEHTKEREKTGRDEKNAKTRHKGLKAFDDMSAHASEGGGENY